MAYFDRLNSCYKFEVNLFKDQTRREMAGELAVSNRLKTLLKFSYFWQFFHMYFAVTMISQAPVSSLWLLEPICVHVYMSHSAFFLVDCLMFNINFNTL